MDAKKFIEILESNNVSFFTGVPDSILSSFCNELQNSYSQSTIIAANEGNAIATATGYYLATKNVPMVFLQNSGIGNMLNPLISLASKNVYGIPMLLLIGWRGEPQTKDEIQHLEQGNVTLPLLELLKIPYYLINNETKEIRDIIKNAIKTTTQQKHPVAFVVSKNFFNSSRKQNSKNSYIIHRKDAIKLICDYYPSNTYFFSTTGKISRELFTIRKETKCPHIYDFLMVGSMGHISQIAATFAAFSKKRVCCFDGDGALLMHLGALPIISSLKSSQFIHVLLNNEMHESVGKIQLENNMVNYKKIASAAGYKFSFSVDNYSDLENTLKYIETLQGNIFLEIKISSLSSSELERPNFSPAENKEFFLKNYFTQISS